MPIDITAERAISFASAAKFLVNGSRPTHSTWWRWWRRGIKGVHLETVVVGGRRYTTAEAVERFVAATTIAGSAEALEAQQRIQLHGNANALELRPVIQQADRDSCEAGS